MVAPDIIMALGQASAMVRYYVGAEISLVQVTIKFNGLLTNHHTIISLPGQLLPQTINYRHLRLPPVVVRVVPLRSQITS